MQHNCIYALFLSEKNMKKYEKYYFHGGSNLLISVSPWEAKLQKL